MAGVLKYRTPKGPPRVTVIIMGAGPDKVLLGRIGLLDDLGDWFGEEQGWPTGSLRVSR